MKLPWMAGSGNGESSLEIHNASQYGSGTGESFIYGYDPSIKMAWRLLYCKGSKRVRENSASNKEYTADIRMASSGKQGDPADAFWPDGHMWAVSDMTSSNRASSSDSGMTYWPCCHHITKY